MTFFLGLKNATNVVPIETPETTVQIKTPLRQNKRAFLNSKELRGILKKLVLKEGTTLQERKQLIGVLQKKPGTLYCIKAIWNLEEGNEGYETDKTLLRALIRVFNLLRTDASVETCLPPIVIPNLEELIRNIKGKQKTIFHSVNL